MLGYVKVSYWMFSYVMAGYCILHYGATVLYMLSWNIMACLWHDMLCQHMLYYDVLAHVITCHLWHVITCILCHVISCAATYCNMLPCVMTYYCIICYAMLFHLMWFLHYNILYCVICHLCCAMAWYDITCHDMLYYYTASINQECSMTWYVPRLRVSQGCKGSAGLHFYLEAQLWM